jgi:hypothetical protein
VKWTPPTPTPKQQEAIRAIYLNDNVLTVCAWGVGKSVVDAWAGYLSATDWEPGLDGFFFAPTFGQLHRTIVKAFVDVVARPGSYRLISSGVNPRIEIPLPRRRLSTIYLLSGEETTSARMEGINAAWGAGDELQDVRRSVWERAAGRIRHRQARRLRRWGSGLPESGTWLEEDLVVEPKPGLVWVQGQTMDNPHLSPAYVENLRRTLPPNLFKSRVLGQFASPEGMVYAPFSRETHVRPCPFNPALRVLIGQDFNNSPMASVILQEVGAETWVVGEVIEPGTTSEHAQKLKAWLKARGVEPDARGRFPRERVVVVPDASGSQRQHATGASDHAILVEAGFALDGPAANPLIKDRDNALLARLQTADGVRHLFVDPSCRRTIAALSGLKHEGRARSEHGHACDALGYPVHRYHALETPNYTATAQALRKANAAAPSRSVRSTW